MNLQQRIERLPVAYGIGISLFTAAVVFALVELRSVIVVVGSSLAGLAGICLLFVVHRLLQRRRAKRRSCALEAGIHRNMVEGGLTSEALRQKWDEGFGKARGKREVLADLPWYLLLGEPHAGKTEAIRPQHSGIGFEPALTDPYQGEGGTKYMDFWFANRAVILDMAGAVMFNEAGEKMFDATETVGPLWEEFLRLLAAHRPDYPINGVFLFIPMDTLISDTPDEIRKKAQTIAERFGTIRQALGVRFPVYVVVSKADKLVGFCEFFENLKDPDLQHQMFGWSNPNELDAPYRSDFVDDCLNDIHDSLQRYRLSRLQERLAEEIPVERKPAAEALYAFPDQFARISSRLKWYLDTIFSPTPYYQPLFFRGIYFTSSLQDWKALDKDLAEVLGITEEELQKDAAGKGRAQRSYFLRDLFEKKAFDEYRLVTQAGHAEKKHRRKQAAVYLLGLAAFVGFGAWLLFLNSEYRERIGNLSGLLRVCDDSDAIRILYEDGLREYRGSQQIQGIDACPRGEYFSQLVKAADDWRILYPTRMPSLEQAEANICWKWLWQPFVDATCWDITSSAYEIGPNPERTTKALCQLVRIRARRDLNQGPGKASENWLDPLYDFHMGCLTSKGKLDSSTVEQHRAKLNEPFARLFRSDKPPKWPALADSRSFPDIDKAITAGIRAFNEYWDDLKQHPEQKALSQIDTLVRKLVAFEVSENAFRDAAKDESAWADIGSKFRVLQERFSAIEADEYGKKGAKGSLKEQRDSYMAARKRRLDDNYPELLEAFGDKRDEGLEAQYSAVTGQQQRHADNLNIPKGLAGAACWDLSDWHEQYRVRLSLYKIADYWVQRRAGLHITTMIRAGEELAQWEKDKEDIKANGPKVKGDSPAAATAERWHTAGRQPVIARAVKVAPRNVRELEELVQGQSDQKESYAVDGVKKVFTIWSKLGLGIDPKTDPSLKASYDKRDEVFAAYVVNYLKHWLQKDQETMQAGPDERTRIPKRTTWQEQAARLKSLDPNYTLVELERFGKEFDRRIEPAERYKADERVKKLIELFERDKTSVTLTNYKDFWKPVLGNWQKLDPDCMRARGQLLKSDFYKTYTTWKSDEPNMASFAERYLFELAGQSLKVLAGEVGRQLQAELDEHQTKEVNKKFPLCRSAGDQEELTVAEAVQLRALLDKLSPPTAGEPKTGNAVDRAYHCLRQPVPKPAWLTKVEKVLRCLPPDEKKPRVCKISLDANQPKLLQNERPLSAIFDKLEIHQDGKATSFALSIQERQGRQLVCPGGPITLTMTYLGSKTSSRMFETPWAAFRMLLANGESSPTGLSLHAEPNGHVKLVAEVQKQQYVLWLELLFYEDTECQKKLDVPPIGDWP